MAIHCQFLQQCSYYCPDNYRGQTFFSHRQAQKYNRQLEEIRTELELRVDERTTTLRESNSALELEVGKHRKTTRQLKHSEAYINSILQSMPFALIGLNKNNKNYPVEPSCRGYQWDIR